MHRNELSSMHQTHSHPVEGTHSTKITNEFQWARQQLSRESAWIQNRCEQGHYKTNAILFPWYFTACFDLLISRLTNNYKLPAHWAGITAQKTTKLHCVSHMLATTLFMPFKLAIRDGGTIPKNISLWKCPFTSISSVEVQHTWRWMEIQGNGWPTAPLNYL